ncbi:Na+/H+ antiporter subunit E [Williamsia sterculiae]|uniref:Multicomponent Na+:H+ antiporter subunit E n=1 Tax=Williamsia sterculiae TaxID=1344003 RepID=A0A1N7F0K2_9NOCA|nr:Na+/H+ antiporter subunit E [Williamsia sterculiae]SIR93762.1 multicomponent Na+:H+ antiporter subunit E [Williamsia sterculiae]
MPGSRRDPYQRGRLRSRLHYAWRVNFMRLAWGLTRAVVWGKTHIHLGRFLGSDNREIAVRLGTLVWLAAVWVLLWGTLTWGNVLAGLGVGLLITLLLPLPRVPVEGRVHPLVVLDLLGRLIVDFFISSAQVAWLTVRPRPPMGAVLRTRLAIRSDMVLTLAVDYINLVPGTMVLEIDHRRRLLYVHVIDVSSDRSVAKFYKQMATVERLFTRAFERESEWRPSPYHGVDDDFHAVIPAERMAASERPAEIREGS